MGRGRLVTPIDRSGRLAGSRAGRGAAVLALVLAVVGCAGINNDPINKPLEALAQQETSGAGREAESHFDDTVIALAFSGGGMRAAAFSHGVLTGLADTSIRTRGGPVSLADRIDIISGVSGGSVPAAYFGLKKRAALDDFRERFLLRNAEEALSTDVNITNLARGFSGGINDSTKFPGWLDANLFNGATFADLSTTQRRTSEKLSPISFPSIRRQTLARRSSRAILGD